ncbi:MAG: hypothetical protein K6E98_09680 [Lachnospiraceae bacterium]|nr:hypothetical protein [Lachnospiraceae bacterium]
MKFRNIKIITILLLIIAFSLNGCNGNNNAEATEETDETASDSNTPEVITVSGNSRTERNINFIQTPSVPTLNIEQNSTLNDIAASIPTTAPTPTLAPVDESAPQFFDVEDAVEPVMGYSDTLMCDALIEAINVNRKNFDVGLLTKNQSLCVAADVRAREYAIYPVYKRRPDDRYFTTISPQGYVKDEYFCIPERTANATAPSKDPATGTYTTKVPTYPYSSITPQILVNGLLEIREARNIMMNPEYKQVGATWFVNGNYFIAGFTFSY